MPTTVTAEIVDHRRATAERNVQAILDGAQALVEDGEQLSIAAVAKSAGVSRVTVYAHFDTREAILQAVVERAVARAATAFDEATADAATATQALERALSTAWDRLGRHTAIAEAATSQLSSDTLRGTHQAAHGRVIAMIERGRDAGEFRTDVPTTWLASVFHTLLHAAGDDVRAKRLSEDDALNALTITVRSALLAPRPPS